MRSGSAHRRWKAIGFALLLCAASTAGCGCAVTDYMGHVVVGELDLLASAVPIEAALADPALTDTQREKLALIIDARDYAEQVVGLSVGNSYQRFVNLHDQSLAWNLTASREDAIEPYVWNLPIVGPFPFLGFFDYDRAVAERDRLVAAGYDTLLYELDAFSTLGLLPDPVASSLLERPTYSMVETVFHELLHNTIWSGTDVVYDESLANFVGRKVGLEFLDERFGPDNPHSQEAHNAYEDAGIFNDFLSTLRSQLEEVYKSDLSREEKVAAREPIFEAARSRLADEVLPQLHAPDLYAHFTETTLNNAFLLINKRYHSQGDLFETLYEQVGRDWASALAVFAEASTSENPFEALRVAVNHNAN